MEEININSEFYPVELKNIYDAPKKLYVIGDKTILNKVGIAIVGCRNNTKYGELIAKNFAYNLSKKGFVIISGLAKGIDSFAHIGALYAKEKTIAVLGSGVDVIYPKENEILAKKIIEYGGCIVSEYPMGTKPEKMYFPARNRIISGISKAVVVVEAQEKSGSLITAEFALEQGKDIFAVPGNITNLNSIGTNKLIQDGAIPATCWEDVAGELT